MKQIILNHKTYLDIDDIALIANKQAHVCISDDAEFIDLINKGADAFTKDVKDVGQIYGVTTGYGDDCTRAIPLNLIDALPRNLMRFHGCGLGEYLSPWQTRAVLIIRLNSLCRGYSGVSYTLLKRLTILLREDILPRIPSEGSVGASGDLTPLSYVAAVLCGEREVLYKDEVHRAEDILRRCHIEPYQLQPKEALAIMNGTAVMTAFAIEAYLRAAYLVDFSSRLTAMTCLALEGNPIHFDQAFFPAKPHCGQEQVAARIRYDLTKIPEHFPSHRLQDRYSTRCAPHVIGVLADMLPSFKSMIEIESNSASDNPLVDIYSDSAPRILSGGHFYGGHIAFVMDSLKILVANIADLLDRQMATLTDVKVNHGLPPNLSGGTGENKILNHGLKAVQIATSAWTAEALKGTMPASVFSRSTENHNQDKVSMGTIAARDTLRVLQLTEQVCAAHMIATLQALRIREQQGRLSRENYSKDMCRYLDEISDTIPYIQEDQRLDIVLKKLVKLIQSRELVLYKVCP